MNHARVMSTCVVLLACLAGAPAHAVDDALALSRAHESDAAIDSYQAELKTLRARDEDDVDVRYALGTLALQKGRLGHAVLHLRMAQRLAPYDDDVRHNLEVALNARIDRIAGATAGHAFDAAAQLMNPRMARSAFGLALALWGVAVALTAITFTRTHKRKLRAALVLCTLGCVGTGVIFSARLALEAREEAVVLAPETPALREPASGSDVAFTAHAGLLGDVVGEEGSFVRLRFENGLEAWLADSALARLP